MLNMKPVHLQQTQQNTLPNFIKDRREIVDIVEYQHIGRNTSTRLMHATLYCIDWYMTFSIGVSFINHTNFSQCLDNYPIHIRCCIHHIILSISVPKKSWKTFQHLNESITQGSLFNELTYFPMHNCTWKCHFARLHHAVECHYPVYYVCTS